VDNDLAGCDTDWSSVDNDWAGCDTAWTSVDNDLEATVGESECEQSYFQAFLEMLSHGTRLRGLPITPGGQVG
jgi:hypothetical protein